MKTKAHVQLNLAKDMKSNVNSFQCCTSSQRRTMENGAGFLVTKHVEKTEVLKSVLPVRYAFRNPRLLRPERRSGAM